MNRIKVVDFHTHIFPTRVARLAINNIMEAGNAYAMFDGTIDGLRENMKQEHVDISICMPVITNPRHTVSINNFAIEVNNTYKDIYSFGGLNPYYEGNDEEIIRLKNAGIKGIKLHPVYQRCPIDDEKFINLINNIIDNGMYVLIHAGADPAFPNDDSSSVDRMVRMLNSIHDESKVILAHLGGLFQFDESFERIAGRKVYLDLAMSLKKCQYRDGSTTDLVSDELFIKFVHKHGSDKILFGSDNPWTPSGEMVDYVMASALTIEEKENILYKNAYRILDLR